MQNRPPRAAPLVAAALLTIAAAAPRLDASEARVRRVLIVTSFGGRFEPFYSFVAELRAEIVRQLPEPIEFYEAPLEMARFAQPAEQAPFADYLATLATGGHTDLVVAIGSPAARFVARYRGRIFDGVPVLITAIDERRVTDLVSAPDEVVVPMRFDFSATLGDMLRVLPDTQRVAVVLGGSPLERLWRVQLEREFAAFAGRLSFVWWNDLSLPKMRDAVAALPPRSAVLYGALYVDAAGVPHEDEGLPAIAAAASAPVFGVYENQLGRGIVGGPLIPVPEEAHRSAKVAVQILRGTPVAQVVVPPREPLRPEYDWRELRRWRIPESRLPAGSEVRYRPPSPYSPQVLAAFGLVILQAGLIGALLAQRARRRRAEERVRDLNRGLLTAQENERCAIARDLHDDFSQRLARLSIDAAGVAEGRSEPREAAREMRAELASLSKDVRSLASQLHPSTLDDLGLVEALRIECDRVSRASGLPVRVETPDSWPAMSREAVLCLFRVAQESLRNAQRHSRASALAVRLEAVDGTARVAVRDDGQGFEADRGRRGAGLGLLSMRERIELVGGRLTVRSAPGQGTTVEASVPLNANSP